MATFLVTPRMSPALAARIEQSVRGARARGGRRHGAVLAPRHVFFLRLALASFGVALVLSAALLRHHGQQELETARASLLAAVRDRGASLGGGGIPRAEVGG